MDQVRNACHNNFKKRTKKFLEREKKKTAKSWVRVYKMCLKALKIGVEDELKAKEPESEPQEELREAREKTSKFRTQKITKDSTEKEKTPMKIYKQTLKPMCNKKSEIQWKRPHRHHFSKREVDEVTGMVTKICECGFKLTTEEV